jgi:hypothetical protein
MLTDRVCEIVGQNLRTLHFRAERQCDDENTVFFYDLRQGLLNAQVQLALLTFLGDERHSWRPAETLADFC